MSVTINFLENIFNSTIPRMGFKCEFIDICDGVVLIEFGLRLLEGISTRTWASRGYRRNSSCCFWVDIIILVNIEICIVFFSIEGFPTRLDVSNWCFGKLGVIGDNLSNLRKVVACSIFGVSGVTFFEGGRFVKDD